MAQVLAGGGVEASCLAGSCLAGVQVIALLLITTMQAAAFSSSRPTLFAPLLQRGTPRFERPTEFPSSSTPLTLLIDEASYAEAVPIEEILASATILSSPVEEEVVQANIVEGLKNEVVAVEDVPTNTWLSSPVQDDLIQVNIEGEKKAVVPVENVPSDTSLSSTVPSFRKLVTFLSTTCLIWLSEPLLSLVDTTFVSWTQGSAVVQLAAMGPATTYMDTLLYLTYFLAIATTNQLATLLNSDNNHRDLQECTSQLLGVALVAGGLVTLFTISAGPFLLQKLAGASARTAPRLVPLATNYSLLRASVAPMSIAGMVSQAFCLVTGHTSTVAAAVGVASVVNIVGDLFLTPRFGLHGAAIATAMASAASSLLLLRRVRLQMKQWRKEEVVAEEQTQSQVRLLGSNKATIHNTEGPQESLPVPLMSLPDRRSLVELIRLSLPLAFNMLARMGSYSALTVAANAFGATALAAQNVLVRVFYFLCCLADSLGQAAQTFVPATVHPKLQPINYRKVLSRLFAVASVAALGGGQLGKALLGRGATLLARDTGVAGQLQTAGPYVALSLFLHPFITVLEGSVIAKREFSNLFKTYAVTLTLYAGILRFGAGSLGGVWRALVFWQISRLFNYLLWRNRRPAIDSSTKTSIKDAVAVPAAS